jgi:II/X family phage/plasmid replication protein
MIDTCKFLIPIDLQGYQALTEDCDIHSCIQSKTKQKKYQIVKVPINIGSFSEERIIRIPHEFSPDSENYAVLELSIPKYYFGHNVRMITISQFKEICKLIEKDLKETLGFVTNRDSWRIQRLDICYNWKLNSPQELENYITIFQNLEYPRKKKRPYDTSVMFVGSAYTVKFYDKHSEYLANSFNELKKSEEVLAYDLIEFSESVLRFETELRKTQLVNIFNKKNIYIDDITEDLVTRLLNEYLIKFLKLENTEISTNIDAHQRLIEFYGDVKGRNTYEKLRLWSSLDPTDKKTFNSYSYANRYKFFEALKKANISLIGDFSSRIKLEIPSENAVF